MGNDTHHRDTSVNYSRRGFIQMVTIGAGVAGSSLLASRTLASPAISDTPWSEPMDSAMPITLDINRRHYKLLVEPRWSLLYVLREIIGLTGTKIGCDRGECGACTVLMDGVPRYSCLTLAVEAEGREIVTVEGLMTGEELGDVQEAFVRHDAFQCGYCTSGQIMAVEGLLRRQPQPTDEEIRIGCSGNLCRCGAYQNIFAAAQEAGRMKQQRKG